MGGNGTTSGEGPAMAEEPNEGGRGSGRWVWLGLLLLVPVLYVLSIGPALLIQQKSGAGGQVIKVVYKPLGLLHKHRALREPLGAYIDFWLRGVGGGS